MVSKYKSFVHRKIKESKAFIKLSSKLPWYVDVLSQDVAIVSSGPQSTLRGWRGDQAGVKAEMEGPKVEGSEVKRAAVNDVGRAEDDVVEQPDLLVTLDMEHCVGPNIGVSGEG